MKPKTHQSRSSTSFSPIETNHKIKENDLKSRRSISKLNLDAHPTSADETLFETLMGDPTKRNLLLQILSQEKDNIKEYKRNEEKKTRAKLESNNRRFVKNQRLLHCESPTALQRRRALLKGTRRESDSGSSTTSDSQTATPSPVPFNDLLKGVVAYIEIRNKEGDRSAGAKALMRSMGATVVDHFGKEVTHVLFKDGSFNTYQRAKLKKVHLVSVLWLEAVRRLNVRVPEKNYPALGTEAYDANISAICQDYEEVVRDEYCRSLALVASGSTAESFKGRKTALPKELLAQQRLLDESTSSSASFHTADRSTEIIPSSQDWEAESVISHESGYPLFRRPISTVKEEESDRLLTSPDLTSDASSDCGVIDGHSVRHIRDSLLDDLNAASEKVTANISLSRKSFPNRKSSHSIVDMDLTKNVVVEDENLGRSNKENLKSKPRRSANLTKMNKRALSSDNSTNVIDNITEVDSVKISKKRNTISSVDLRSQSDNSCRALMGSTDRTSLGSSTHSLPEVAFQNRTSNSKNSHLEISRTEEQPNVAEEALKSRQSRKKTKIIEMCQNQKRVSNSESMSPLKISLDSSGKDKRKNSSETVTSSFNSEVIPSLRISDNSSKASEKSKASSAHRSSSRKSVQPQQCQKDADVELSTKSRQEIVARRSARISNEGNACQKDSLNSEDLPPLRVSTDSTNDAANPLTTPPSASNAGHSLLNSGSLKVVLDKIISTLEVPKGTNLKNSEGPCKRKKLKQDQPKTTENPAGKNKKMRKLYNLNQSISDTAQNWNLRATENQGQPSTVNEAIFTKKLIVPLTPLLLTYTAKKFLKSQKMKAVSQTEPKATKVVPERPERKSRKKLYVDEDRDEQKELAKEYTDKVSKRKCNDEGGDQPPKKRAEDEQTEDGKKQTTEIQRRRSQRLSHCPKPADKGDSNSNSKMPILPKLSRRSTLDFVQAGPAKSQKKLTQRGRKVRASIVCTRMHKPEVQEFMQIVKKLGVLFVEDEVSEKTTHLVVGEPKRTINLLRAIARGCWIVTKEWLYRSLEASKWLKEEDFELTSFSSSVQQCRLQREAFGRLYSMDIFANCGPIYIARGSIPRCSDLEELVKLCKGTVVKVAYNASIVVGEWVRYDGVACVNEKWILDSITFNKRKSFKNYLIKQKS